MPGIPVPTSQELTKLEFSYKGFHRNIIDDFIDEYYEKKLPEELSKIWAEMQEHEYGPTGSELTKNFDDALKIFKYCHNKKKKTEIITMYCEDWAQDEEPFDCFHKLEFLGYDITLKDTYESIILTALFFRPEYFGEYIPLLNKNGLFMDKAVCSKYTELYRTLARKEIFEPEGCGSQMQIVEIYRVIEADDLAPEKL